jgi:hypothetical protein
MEYTLTYSDGSGGWPSFYSYIPDWMIGMNNYFYTFRGGNLFRHNVNAVRNQFYGKEYPSQITSVFNTAPLENKLFKTLSLQGDDAWEALAQTDIQTTGFVQKDWFEKKEQVYFAFIRNSGQTPANVDEYALRSLNGIGRSIVVTPPVTGIIQVQFSINPLIAIGNIASVGDYLYYALPPSYNSPLLCGRINDIVQNYPAGDNYFVVDTFIGGAVPPIQDAYFLYIKNSVAESHGVLGHYCVFDLINYNTDKVELFAVESEVMKSFP